MEYIRLLLLLMYLHWGYDRLRAQAYIAVKTLFWCGDRLRMQIYIYINEVG